MRTSARKSDLARVLESPYLFAWDYSPHRDRKHGAPPPPELLGDRFVVCIQNHDQVGNRASGDRLHDHGAVPGTTAACPQPAVAVAPTCRCCSWGRNMAKTRPFPFFCSFSDPQLIQNVREGRRREFAAFAWQGDVPDPQAEATFASARLSWSGPRNRQRRAAPPACGSAGARRRWPALRDGRRRPTRLLPDQGRGPNPGADPRRGRPDRADLLQSDRTATALTEPC